MFKVYMEKEIKGASKMNAEELLQALLKDVDGENGSENTHLRTLRRKSTRDS